VRRTHAVLGFSRPKSSRRTTAAPARGVFHFGRLVRTHGLIASVSFMGVPCGTPQGVPVPIARSANPHGAARPLAGARGLIQLAIGVQP
jgi:hypothetical protein